GYGERLLQSGSIHFTLIRRTCPFEGCDTNMNTIPLMRWLLACIVTIAVTASAHAQPKQKVREYERFDFDVNVEKLLKDRLQMEKDLGPLKDLIKKIAEDPSKFPVD